MWWVERSGGSDFVSVVVFDQLRGRKGPEFVQTLKQDFLQHYSGQSGALQHTPLARLMVVRKRR